MANCTLEQLLLRLQPSSAPQSESFPAGELLGSLGTAGDGCRWPLAVGYAPLDAGQSQAHLLLLLAVFLAFALVAALAFAARTVGTGFNAISLAKQAPYECGFQPFEKLDRCSLFLFYRLAVFFVLFEAELIFLYPWVITLAGSGANLAFFAAALPFLALLLGGFVLELNRGALNL